MVQSSRLTVPSAFCAVEIATTSAWRVTSRSCATRLMDSATTSPLREITTPYGYSPSSPERTERSMQRCIIARSVGCIATMVRQHTAFRGRARRELAEGALRRRPRRYAAWRLALDDDGSLGAAAADKGNGRLLARRRRFRQRGAHVLGRHVHQSRRDRDLLLHVVGQPACREDRLPQRRGIVADPPGAVFGLPGRAHVSASCVGRLSRYCNAASPLCNAHSGRKPSIQRVVPRRRPDCSPANEDHPPAMSRGEKLRSSTFHSLYLSAGRKAYGWQSLSVRIAGFIRSGPSWEALASISSGSAARRPSGLRNTRSTTRVVCASLIPSGSFQHVFKCALKALFASVGRFAAVVDSASNPGWDPVGRFNSAGIFAGSKIQGSEDCAGAGAGAGTGT